MMKITDAIKTPDDALRKGGRMPYWSVFRGEPTFATRKEAVAYGRRVMKVLDRFDEEYFEPHPKAVSVEIRKFAIPVYRKPRRSLARDLPAGKSLQANI